MDYIMKCHKNKGSIGLIETIQNTQNLILNNIRVFPLIVRKAQLKSFDEKNNFKCLNHCMYTNTNILSIDRRRRFIGRFIP